MDRFATTINQFGTLTRNLTFGIEGLKDGLGQMKLHVDGIKFQLNGIEERMGNLETRLNRLDNLLFEVIKREQDAMKQFSDLGWGEEDM